MSEYISPFFVNPAELPEDGYGLIQMTFLMSIYIYILALAADMISDGSELLLLIPKLDSKKRGNTPHLLMRLSLNPMYTIHRSRTNILYVQV